MNRFYRFCSQRQSQIYQVFVGELPWFLLMFRRCIGFFWTLLGVKEDDVILGQDRHSEESDETNGGWSMERLFSRNR